MAGANTVKTSRILNMGDVVNTQTGNDFNCGDIGIGVTVIVEKPPHALVSKHFNLLIEKHFLPFYIT